MYITLVHDNKVWTPHQHTVANSQREHHVEIRMRIDLVFDRVEKWIFMDVSRLQAI